MNNKEWKRKVSYIKPKNKSRWPKQSRQETYENDDSGSGLIVIGIIASVTYLCMPGNWDEFIDGVTDFSKDVFDTVVDEVDEFIEGTFKTEEENKSDEEHIELTPTKKVEPLFTKRPLAIHFNDNKTLILFPEHVVDQDNLINPQWRLQLG